MGAEQKSNRVYGVVRADGYRQVSRGHWLSPVAWRAALDRKAAGARARRKANPDVGKREAAASKRWLRKLEAADPAGAMWARSRRSAAQRGIEFTIGPSDVVIPERCPVLGMPLVRNEGLRRDNSPTLDRIRNELGYVPGNVAVVSYRANRLKSDASLDELRAITKFYCR